jgi:hypothetical protein
MFKNIVERGRPQMTIWRMRIEYLISRATIAHSLCNVHCFSATRMVAGPRLNVTLYVQCSTCIAIRTVQYLYCYTYSAVPVLLYVQCSTCIVIRTVQYLYCYTYSAVPVLLYVQCSTCIAIRAVQYLYCYTYSAVPVLLHVRNTTAVVMLRELGVAVQNLSPRRLGAREICTPVLNNFSRI